MSIESITFEESSILDENIYIESSTIQKVSIKSQGFFSRIGDYFRDRFFLPLSDYRPNTYFDECERHGASIVKMFQGKEKALDPTFPQLSKVIKNFTLKDVPIKVASDGTLYQFNVRIIEGKGLRLVLMSAYGHSKEIDGKIQPWKPSSLSELSVAPVEVLRAVQQFVSVDSLICHSLGNTIMEGLKEYPEDVLPKTVVVNRGLTSVSKVAGSFFGSFLGYFAGKGASILGWDGNPEKALVDHFKRFPKSLDDRKVVIVESKRDSILSGKAAFDADYEDQVRLAGPTAYRGSFSIPYISKSAHHSCRLDWIVNNTDSGTLSENFLPIEKNESISHSIAKNVFKEKTHTCLIVGGRMDTLNSITYLQALPLLSSYLETRS